MSPRVLAVALTWVWLATAWSIAPPAQAAQDPGVPAPVRAAPDPNPVAAARGAIGAATAPAPGAPAPPATGIAVGRLDALGRPTGASATITPAMIGTGRRARGTPPGFVSGAGYHRSHLMGRQFGGTGARDNVVTLFGSVNLRMSTFEALVRRAVDSGETVRYSVTPLYRGSELIPHAVTMSARGSGGFTLDVTVRNLDAAHAPPVQPPGGSSPILAPQGGAVQSTGVAGAQTLGGVDLSTLELRYVSDVSTAKTRAASFAFKAQPGGRVGVTGAGAGTARQASDAFFVWLALPPRTFTVNLNPDEPDRIVDERFGRTNAGRVLLEADLRMKKVVGRLIHPDRPLGRRYWSEIRRVTGSETSCQSFRQWIVPAEATVRETGGELYILKAPLSVKLEADYFKARGAASNRFGACDRDSPGQARIEAVYRRMILPRVQRAVRRAPEFAALRRVYFSRVAAEWYRQRGTRYAGAFSDVVGSGDIASWTQTRSWTPRDVFDRYVRSFREGEFNVTRRSYRGTRYIDRTYVYGGVDFSNVPRSNVSDGELQAMRPGLPERISRALSAPDTDPRSGEVWLAGASFDRVSAAGDPALRNPTGALFVRPAQDGLGGIGSGGIGLPGMLVVAALALAGLAWLSSRWIAR